MVSNQLSQSGIRKITMPFWLIVSLNAMTTIINLLQEPLIPNPLVSSKLIEQNTDVLK